MRLITFKDQLGTHVGVLEENDIVINLPKAYLLLLQEQGECRAQEIADAYIPNNMVSFLEGGNKSLELAKETIEYALKHKSTLLESGVVQYRDNIRLEAPVQYPKKIICVGHNYREHILEMKREIPEYPILFAKFSHAAHYSGCKVKHLMAVLLWALGYLQKMTSQIQIN